jgi:hypothetical protein
LIKNKEFVPAFHKSSWIAWILMLGKIREKKLMEKIHEIIKARVGDGR